MSSRNFRRAEIGARDRQEAVEDLINNNISTRMGHSPFYRSDTYVI